MHKHPVLSPQEMPPLTYLMNSVMKSKINPQSPLEQGIAAACQICDDIVQAGRCHVSARSSDGGGAGNAAGGDAGPGVGPQQLVRDSAGAYGAADLVAGVPVTGRDILVQLLERRQEFLVRAQRLLVLRRRGKSTCQHPLPKPKHAITSQSHHQLTSPALRPLAGLLCCSRSQTLRCAVTGRCTAELQIRFRKEQICVLSHPWLRSGQ